MNRQQTWVTLTLAWFGLLSNAGAVRPEIGEAPASLAQHLEYVDGSAIDLAALKGKPTILYFGGDWCQPCRDYGRPAVLRVRRAHEGSDLHIVFIAMDDNQFREAKIAEAKHLQLPIAMPKLSNCQPYKCPGGIRNLGDFGYIYGLPTAILMNREGLVVDKMLGGRGIDSWIDNAVAKLMAQSPGK